MTSSQNEIALGRDRSGEDIVQYVQYGLAVATLFDYRRRRLLPASLPAPAAGKIVIRIIHDSFNREGEIV